MMIAETRIDSPLGPLRLLADERGLRGLYMQRHQGEPLASESADTPEHPLSPRTAKRARTQAAGRVRAESSGAETILRMAAQQLREYFAGDRRVFELPLAAEGTEFQQRVWQALMALEFGQTCSYGELARAIGQPSASRAVGAANGRNPLSIVVPCHRVIGSDGSLTGYGGGEANKRWLLEHEARLSDPLFARRQP